MKLIAPGVSTSHSTNEGCHGDNNDYKNDETHVEDHDSDVWWLRRLSIERVYQKFAICSVSLGR